MALPTTKSKPTRKSPKILIIYGPPKVGKTTAISMLDNCLDIDLENGSDYLEILKVKCNNYGELLMTIKEIKENNKPYKYLAIDTITKLEEWAEEEAKRLYKASTVGKNFDGNSVLELPNGAGYLWLRQAFQNMIMNVCSAAENVIFVCHLREKLLGGKDIKQNTMVSSKDLELTGKCKQILCAMADAIGYIYRDANSSKLKINFMSTEQVNCGSRCDHLKGQDLELDWSKIYVD